MIDDLVFASDFGLRQVESQGTIGLWADQTFPARNGLELGVRVQCLKLMNEATELAVASGANRHEILAAVAKGLVPLDRDEDQFRRHLAPDKVPEEAADCVIVLCVIACRAMFRLGHHVVEKMAINRKRKQVVNPDGSAQHIKES